MEEEKEYDVICIVQTPTRLNDKRQRLKELIETNTVQSLLEAKILIIELINDKWQTAGLNAGDTGM